MGLDDGGGYGRTPGGVTRTTRVTRKMRVGSTRNQAAWLTTGGQVFALWTGRELTYGPDGRQGQALLTARLPAVPVEARSVTGQLNAWPAR